MIGAIIRKIRGKRRLGTSRSISASYRPRINARQCPDRQHEVVEEYSVYEGVWTECAKCGLRLSEPHDGGSYSPWPGGVPHRP